MPDVDLIVMAMPSCTHAHAQYVHRILLDAKAEGAEKDHSEFMQRELAIDIALADTDFEHNLHNIEAVKPHHCLDEVDFEELMDPGLEEIALKAVMHYEDEEQLEHKSDNSESEADETASTPQPKKRKGPNSGAGSRKTRS